MTLAGGEPMEWTGVRAPSLRRTAEPKWGKPIALLNGRDLTGWHVNGANSWEVAGGELRNTKSGGNLVTDRTFDDFKLHVDFRVPKGGNSGVYLRGRYEVQIADSSADDATSLGALGALVFWLSLGSCGMFGGVKIKGGPRIHKRDVPQVTVRMPLDAVVIADGYVRGSIGSARCARK